MAKNHFVLFDGEERSSLLPFTYTRAICDIRIGILRIQEKWNLFLGQDCSVFSHQNLQLKYPFTVQSNMIFINAAVLPDLSIIESIINLPIGHSLVNDSGKVIALNPDNHISTLNHLHILSKTSPKIKYSHAFTSITHPWDIFTHNGAQIQSDVKLMKLEPNGHLLEKDNKVLHPENIYIEEGAQALWSMLNADKGPIYLGKHSEVMEGAIIKGNTAICEHSSVKMGAKIYGDTTIGPHCKVGGEVGNSVIFGFSNKGHDGYLGNSVIGEWCNLGADTNNSNLKNNYSSVKSWSYSAGKEINTGLQFCGLIMGDHSKCGINTMFNTGTVVGVSANIYGGNFPPKFIPSFSWGGSDGLVPYEFEKALETAQKVMERRIIKLSDTDRQILWQVYEDSSIFRKN
jgi:UDP-N-acetylglucosamine diphosphorylase/glucosamine-1-phosphate N-acetyltransferase